ncbi:excinuclease ABC subunit C [Curtobacterium sp. MCBD17_034]|uniref:excinuclease ABC subunit UvrC n=1 Tax=unclassified Curtobacterium TaxID=257496 RepID=UPI000DA9A895|nr:MULTISPECIES: excinuclease ABC subunit UvrC [unclassified Curtobacterium]PZE77145.1 excinuclease ABC subunit C [Curtobacterium sp. MCBD17_019]PZF59175.1 excinuclease ABC subunit C [Curtobacterium sp. MCBD17_034]PZM34283.1 excinuclease ABC subunit C [Curtobacterium sp. MCBD17_031]WIB62269.1 excinuclease ABC subunit UvrC [Curtobacterium sp. MCBD17_040]
MADTVPWRPRASEIPTDPGVYRWRDADGRVLYVGKAKNLRARLSNYFAPLPTLHERTRRMVLTAASVEWTVVGSEIEALQLEYTWIKEFDPPFNVKFRDDKSYPYMAITLGDEAPRVMVTRNRKIRGAKYFGPYPKIWAVHDTIDLMIKVFPIRTCSDSSYKRAMQTGRPCFPGQIGKCGGPCSGRVSIEEHRAIVEEFVRFMGSYDRRVISERRARMAAAADAMHYEEAARYRDQVEALEAVLEKSAVVLRDSVDLDLFGVAEDELAAAVQQFTVRGGRIRGVRGWVVDKELDISTGELVEQIVQSVYAGAEEPPREVVVPALPEDADALETWLSEQRGGRAVRLSTAQRGDRAGLAKTATVNAAQALMLYKTKRSADYTTRSAALADIQDALGMTEAPLRMECYDISHLQGTNIVASMVVFEDGLPRKDQYRRYTIAESRDDTDSMYQVLSRRLARLDEDADLPTVADPTSDEVVEQGTRTKRFAYRPQLLIVDGGQPQVEAAARAMADAGVTDIALCGIAKRLEEIWLPGDDFPVILPRNSEALFLIQRIRDEAHRFAITHQRTRRKRDVRSRLAEIPGLGPTRVNGLLKHFGSVARLRDATPEEIAEVPGIGPATAAAVRRQLDASAPTSAPEPGSAPEAPEPGSAPEAPEPGSAPEAPDLPALHSVSR